MTKLAQKQIAQELAESIAKSFEGLVDNDWIPEEWDGHEIRCWLADRYKQAAERSVIRLEPKSKRAREYRNTKIVRNL